MKRLILKKKGRKLLSILLVLIFVLSATSCKKEEDANKDEPNTKIEKEQKEEENKISQLHEGKEIVYDANYLDEFKPYMGIDFGNEEVEVNFNACKIPYINLDSNGAKKINNQILKYTREYIVRDYEDGKEESLVYKPMASYKYEVTDQYISIWFEYYMGLIGNPAEVGTFILDLKTGEELSLDKAIEISGVDEDFVGLIEGKIVEFYEDMLKDSQDSGYYDDTSLLNFQENTLYNFWKEYYGGKLDYYLNSENELTLLLEFAFPARGGNIQMELEIKPEDLPIQEEINPIYQYLAKEDYNSYEGGVAFLGYKSFNTMKAITSKLEGIIYKFGDQGKLPLFYFYNELDDGSYIVNGDEFYLLAAKYKNSVIKIYESVNDESGEAVFEDQTLNIYGSNCISFCNFSDIRPNTKVEFIYRDKAIEFSPLTSLMDSSYINEIAGIIDLGEAYRELEKSEINLESTGTLPYMWRIFKMEGFID